MHATTFTGPYTITSLPQVSPSLPRSQERERPAGLSKLLRCRQGYLFLSPPPLFLLTSLSGGSLQLFLGGAFFLLKFMRTSLEMMPPRWCVFLTHACEIG